MGDTARTMDPEQAEKLVAQFREYLTSYAAHITHDVARIALGTKGFMPEMFKTFQVLAQSQESTIILEAEVNLKLTFQEALRETRRKITLEEPPIDGIPRGTSERVSVHFFKPGRVIDGLDVLEEYKLRGLVPVDPFSLAAIFRLRNEYGEHSGFIRFSKIATPWTDPKGDLCYEVFDYWGEEYWVVVRRNNLRWSDDYWFAGVPE